MNKVADIATGALVVAGVMVLTRKGSQGPALFGAVTSGFAHITEAATGQRLQRI